MKNTLSIGKNGFFILLLIMLVFQSEAPAQVLNEKVNSLLSNNCAGLGSAAVGGSPDFGSELNALCAFPQQAQPAPEVVVLHRFKGLLHRF